MTNYTNKNSQEQNKETRKKLKKKTQYEYTKRYKNKTT